MEFTRVFEILPYQLAKFPKADSLASKVNGEWVKYSTAEYFKIANQISVGLMNLGIGKDDKVSIVSSNRPEWNFVDMGIQQLGAVSVPVYPNITIEDYKFIFKDSEAKIIFVANEELFLKATEAVAGRDVKIYTFDVVPGAVHWKSITENVNEADFAKLEPYKAAVLPSDLLTMIYTSGTTGTPKGVMLSHSNVVSQSKSAKELMPVNYQCKAFSFLPLCHVYERMMCYVYQSNGLSIYYAESMDTISDNLKEVHPHIFVTVPRLLEKVYDKIVAKGAELTGIKKMLFFWAHDLGMQYELNTNQGWWFNFRLKLANKLIFSKWREALGGELKVVVSGGAALQPRLARVFSAAQIVIMEGYGLTETSPVIAVNHWEEKDRKIGTVGPLFPGVQVKIAADGEILTKGPHVMMGYYKRPDLTAETINSEGWLHTGDIGEMVENGKFLKITDRKKEMFKTSGGKYIAPGNMENKFKESRFIEQIMVIGESQRFPAALIVPAFAFVKDWCELKGIDCKTNEEMIKNVEVKHRIQQEVDTMNLGYAKYEQIKKIALIKDEWTIQSGEMTPTLKLKRRNIMAKYQTLIDKLYAESVLETA
ncbi:MAG: AMP-dependent synthetase/ligase [Cytophagales bacterium]